MVGRTKPSQHAIRLEQEQQRRTLKDKEKIDTIVQAANGVITQSIAGNILGVLPRQVRRLIDKYNAGGPEAFIHQGRGKPSNHRSDDELRSNVIELISTKYRTSGPDLISYELDTLDGIQVKPETVRRWMIQEGLWTVNDANRVTHRRWRERKPCLGEMVQMDTSVHHWFGDDHDKSYVISMIDDATSRVYFRFYDADSAKTNMDLILRYLRLYGRPLSLYVDRASHFTDNPPKGSRRPLKADKNGPVTQIQRAAEELGIRMIYARSPQGKGRVERLFGTLQKRLVELLKHRGITTIEEANSFVTGKFIPHWEDRYTVAPLSETNVHRSVEGYDLEGILSVQESRTVTNDYSFQHCGCRYQIEAGDIKPNMRRNKVIVQERLDGTLRACFNGKYINFYLIGRIKVSS
jgi:transposase InsO family protein